MKIVTTEVFQKMILNERKVPLSTEWTKILSDLDKIQNLFSGQLANVLYLTKGQICYYLDNEIRVQSSVGRVLVTIKFCDGDWLTMLGYQEAKSNFVFQGCHLEDISPEQCLKFVSKFAEIATTETFLVDNSLTVWF